MSRFETSVHGSLPMRKLNLTSACSTLVEPICRCGTIQPSPRSLAACAQPQCGTAGNIDVVASPTAFLGASAHYKTQWSTWTPILVIVIGSLCGECAACLHRMAPGIETLVLVHLLNRFLESCTNAFLPSPYRTGLLTSKTPWTGRLLSASVGHARHSLMLSHMRWFAVSSVLVVVYFAAQLIQFAKPHISVSPPMRTLISMPVMLVNWWINADRVPMDKSIRSIEPKVFRRDQLLQRLTAASRPRLTQQKLSTAH
jgi:hypothetical protein